MGSSDKTRKMFGSLRNAGRFVEYSALQGQHLVCAKAQRPVASPTDVYRLCACERRSEIFCAPATLQKIFLDRPLFDCSRHRFKRQPRGFEELTASGAPRSQDKPVIGIPQNDCGLHTGLAPSGLGYEFEMVLTIEI